MSRITVNTDICKKDGLCALVCPEAIMVQTEKGTHPVVMAEDECIACGQCVSICPHGAIQHADVPLTDVTPIAQDSLPTADQVMELLMSRRSMRAFRDAPLDRDLIQKVIDAARFAPSARNIQRTEFIVVQDPDVLKQIVDLTIRFQDDTRKDDPNALPAFARLAEAYAKGIDGILHHAPALILMHSDTRVEFPEANANLAHQNAALMAHALGLGCYYAYVTYACQNDDRIPALLDLPEHHRIWAALALGQPRVKFKKRMTRRPAQIRWV